MLSWETFILKGFHYISENYVSHKIYETITLNDCTKVYKSIRTLTLRLNNLMRRAARKSFRKPTETSFVASIMLPTTVTKSNTFQESLK